MKQIVLWLFLSISNLIFALTACNPISTPEFIAPVSIQNIEGSEFVYIILTEKAAQRLGIQETEIKTEQGLRTVVPDAAIFYGVYGDTWVYMEVEPLTYTHYPVRIDYIEENNAILFEGPPSGSYVVTVGGAELLGIETGLDERN